MQGDSNSCLDIIFISYDESNSDKNWLELKQRFPRAKRVHGVAGIREAHKKAAQLSSTHFFFVVDGDNRVCKDFNFDSSKINLSEDTLYVYRCYNPANHLIYGFGAVKIYNKALIEARIPSGDYVDLATTITEKYQIIPIVATETHFFYSPREAWRGAFRECSKLSAGIIARQKNDETKKRLEQWCSKINHIKNADWVMLGARQGREFGENFSHALDKLNDFDWLDRKFDELS